ncbi:MAG: hypothetical protein RDV48_01400 [Candidatus Eremiobacteraeota bacterium]|nr:hypothetical protein [Candidatus Eremiobacteraeota bacterium]
MRYLPTLRNKRDGFFVILCLAVLMAVRAASPASANPGFFGGEGEHIVLTGKGNLVLREEKVLIRITPPFAFVEGIYSLCNPGRENTVEIGFPHARPHKPNEKMGLRKPRDFSVSVNDIPVQYRSALIKKEKNTWILKDEKGKVKKLGLPSQKAAPPGSSEHFWESIYSSEWYMWKTHFNEGEEKTIRCSYEYLLGGLDHFWSLSYMMKTGSTWSQSIKNVDMEADLSENTSLEYYTPPFKEKLASFYTRVKDDMDAMKADCTYNFLVGVSPPGFTIKGNTIVWHFENYKPVDDIWLRWGHPPLSATSVLENSFRYSADKAVDGDPATCWAEGVKGPGCGQRLRIPVKSRFSLLKGGPLSGVSILAGYGKSEEAFQANNRPRKVRLDFCRLSNRGVTRGFCVLRKSMELKDSIKWHDVEIGRFLCADGIALQIDSVYKGKKYDDTAISEVRPELLDLQVTASSSAGSQYLPENVFDAFSAFNSNGDLNTAWVEGVKGPGKGEWVKISWGKKKEVSAITIYPGYGKNRGGIPSGRLFFENNQLKVAYLEFSDNSRKKIAFPKRGSASYEADAFSFKPVMTSSVKLIIGEVYAGTKYDDTCVSDMEINPLKPGVYETVDECW